MNTIDVASNSALLAVAEKLAEQNNILSGGMTTIRGTDGVTFTPHVSADGTLSWTNNGELTNPEPVNIVGNVESIGEILQTTGDSETAVMSQRAITEELGSIKQDLLVVNGNFDVEFEIGRVTTDENSALSYVDNRYEIRSKTPVKTFRGTTFTLSDYTNTVLVVYFSYDDGITYSYATRTASSIDPYITIEQDAIVVIKMYNNPSAVQNGISLADRLIVNVSTLSKKISALDASVQDCKNQRSKDLNHTDLWEKGGIDIEGATYKAAHLCRTKDFLADDIKLIYVEGDYYMTVYCYDLSGTFVGTWNRKEIGDSHQATYYLNTEGLKDYKLRLMIKRYDCGSSYTMDISETANIHFLTDTRAEMFYPTPTLTFIDDDGAKNALENWESIADEIGIKMTFCLNTGVMGDGEINPTKASWSDVHRLQNKGFEFVSHTHNHINITERTEETVIQQFEDSIAALREHGCESRYLVYPYNAIDNTKLPIVKKYFTAAVGLHAAGGYKGTDNFLPLDTYHLGRYSINDTDTYVEKEYNGETVSVVAFHSLDTLKNYIDNAYANGSWLIIMTHLRNDTSYYFDEDVRNLIIDLCKYATQKGFKIQTFGEAFQRYKNRMENGRHYDTSHYIVDCNGITRYRGQ